MFRFPSKLKKIGGSYAIIVTKPIQQILKWKSGDDIIIEVEELSGTMKIYKK